MSANRLVVDEPFGHREYLSKIERAVQRLEPGFAMRRSRTERFDIHSSLLYSPVQYEFEHISAGPSTPPDQDWTLAAFRRFVRGEFSGARSRAAPDVLTPEIAGSTTVRFDVMEDYLERCESEVVYGSILDSIRTSRGDSMGHDVVRVLCHPLIGHAKNNTNIDPARLKDALEMQVTAEERLLFVLPAFPFKDQNPLRSTGPADRPDAGEIAFLINLHIAALAIYQVHPFGADFVVLADGELYANVFGVDPHEAARYRERLRAFRNALNLQGTVHILDLQQLMKTFGGGPGTAHIDDARKAIMDHLRAAADNDRPTGDAFRALRRGMLQNLNSKAELEGVDDHLAWMILNSDDPQDLPREVRDAAAALHARAAEAAFSYAAINLSLQYFDVVARTFPGAIRCTIHPKVGQLALRSEGTVYPWNGVALVDQPAAIGPRSFASHPRHALAGQGSLIACILEGSDDSPFFYTKA